MTSIGTGYDLFNSIFSPDGRNFQVEYAIKAVENGGTSIGIRCKDGVVLAVEKIISSKLQKHGANKRIFSVDRNFGIVFSGLIPDGKHLVFRAREESSSWRDQYKSPIPTSTLADRAASWVQAFTLYQGVRPFGITAIVAGWDSEGELEVDAQVGSGPKTGGGGKVEGIKSGGPGLYMIEPSGLYWGYYGAATGKGRQAAKAELEKLDLAAGKLSLEQGVKEAARIIYVAHEDSKDKEFELEMTWIATQQGQPRESMNTFQKKYKKKQKKPQKRPWKERTKMSRREGMREKWKNDQRTFLGEPCTLFRHAAKGR